MNKFLLKKIRITVIKIKLIEKDKSNLSNILIETTLLSWIRNENSGMIIPIEQISRNEIKKIKIGKIINFFLSHNFNSLIILFIKCTLGLRFNLLIDQFIDYNIKIFNN